MALFETAVKLCKKVNDFTLLNLSFDIIDSKKTFSLLPHRLKHITGRLFHAFLLFTLVAVSQIGQAQDNRLLTVDDLRYRHIVRLQQHGYLLELHPTALPYTYSEVSNALARADTSSMNDRERRWMSLISDKNPIGDTDANIGLHGEVGASAVAINSDRIDVVRTIDNSIVPYQRVYLKGAATRGHWVGQVGMTHSRYYDQDPDGIDTALRVQARAENGYVGFATQPVGIYLGRFSNQWGSYGDTGLLVSDNPRAYDQINLRFGGQKYSFRSFFAELDAITGDGRFTGTAGADSVRSGLERRFLFAHRFDFRPTKNLALTVMESILISGPGTGFSLRFLNPFTAIGLENDNVPKNDENNALLGLMLWWQLGRTTIHSQVIMDDLDVIHLGSERTSVAATANLKHTFPEKPLAVGLSADIVASRTYNTHQKEGQYVYLLRGLGTQFNDFAHVSANVDWFADIIVEGLILGSSVHYLAQGEQRITNPFPNSGDDVPTFLSGIVENTLRVGLILEYQPTRFWWIQIDAGVNNVSNQGHFEGRTKTRFSGLANFGLRLPINWSDKADF